MRFSEIYARLTERQPPTELFVPNTAYANARGNLVVYAPDGQTPIAKLSSNADFDPRGAALRP